LLNKGRLTVKISVRKSRLAGSVLIPASKSHTIRALVIGSLADGTSAIRNPLDAADPLAAADVCGKLGARIAKNGDWTVRGTGGTPYVPDDVLDTGNSGTTLYLTMGTAALAEAVATGAYV
jgi:3-phosphoshikimate 1-carboxyvinyltransferase